MKRRDNAESGHLPGRRTAGRAQEDHVDDPYQRQLKLREPAACPDCGAAYHEGRWQWTAASPDAETVRCPACRRIAEEYPAGIVTLSGAFAREHRQEILALARHQEALEKGEHPLNRIMGIEDKGGAMEIATTDIHLPRRIGEAVHSAYRGDLDFHYDSGRYFLRVMWSRED